MISQKKGFIFCYNSRQIELINCNINYRLILYCRVNNKKKLSKLIDDYVTIISLNNLDTKTKILKKLNKLSQNNSYKYSLVEQIQNYKTYQSNQKEEKKDQNFDRLDFDKLFFCSVYNPLKIAIKRRTKDFGNIDNFGLFGLEYYSSNNLFYLRQAYYLLFKASVDSVIINTDLYKIKFKSVNNAEKTYITSTQISNQIDKNNIGYKTLQIISSPLIKKPESKKSIKTILTRIRDNTFGKFGFLIQQLLKDLLKESKINSEKKEIQIVGSKTDKIKKDILIDIPRKKIIVINFIKQLGLEKFYSDNLDINLMLEAIRMSDLGDQKKFKDCTIEAINKALIAIESSILSEPEDKRFFSLQEMNNLDSLKFIVELITDDDLLEVKEEIFDSEEYLTLMDKNPS